MVDAQWKRCSRWEGLDAAVLNAEGIPQANANLRQQSDFLFFVVPASFQSVLFI